MRFNLAILIALVMALTLFTSAAMAGNPLKKDEKFLDSDPDGDGLITREEFFLGTDPFNSDSDNDGLPDGWEKEYYPQMNPADSSDAHKDFDFEPVSNGTGFNQGEREATFDAVKKPMDYWPSNPDVSTTQPVFDEEGPHYDNYEEYYRPYTDLVDNNLIRYMHTNPLKPDTDGDLILDPDDFEPLGWANDGASPGGADMPEVNGVSKDPTSTTPSAKEVPDQYYEPIVPENINMPIEYAIAPAEHTPPAKNSKDEYLPDVDNDGI
jgi:hypothetical protein